MADVGTLLIRLPARSAKLDATPSPGEAAPSGAAVAALALLTVQRNTANTAMAIDLIISFSPMLQDDNILKKLDALRLLWMS